MKVYLSSKFRPVSLDWIFLFYIKNPSKFDSISAISTWFTESSDNMSWFEFGWWWSRLHRWIRRDSGWTHSWRFVTWKVCCILMLKNILKIKCIIKKYFPFTNTCITFQGFVAMTISAPFLQPPQPYR